MKIQKSRTARTILKKKSGEFRIPDFKSQSKTTVIKTMYYLLAWEQAYIGQGTEFKVLKFKYPLHLW